MVLRMRPFAKEDIEKEKEKDSLVFAESSKVSVFSFLRDFAGKREPCFLLDNLGQTKPRTRWPS